MLRVVQPIPDLGRLLARLGRPLAAVSETHAFCAVVRVDAGRGIARRRLAKLEPRTEMALIAGAIIDGTRRLSGEDSPQDLAPQVTAAALLKALGVPSGEAGRLARSKLGFSSIAGGGVLAIPADGRA